jgi:hypothetical protein
MRISTLLARSLSWYWRTNLSVVLGVATATGVLGGALLVGDSVRGSLRELVLARLGNADSTVTSSGFFREELAEVFPSACPLIVMQGLVVQEDSGRRAAGVQVYGIDDFEVCGLESSSGSGGSSAGALARERGRRRARSAAFEAVGDSAQTLHGRGRFPATVRLAMFGVASAIFLRPQQGDVRAVYVPLARLQGSGPAGKSTQSRGG